MLHAISFRLATLDTSLPEGGYRDVEGAVPYQFDLCLTCGRSKPLPYRHLVPYPPKGGISSRFSVYIIKATPCISSLLGVYRFITFA